MKPYGFQEPYFQRKSGGSPRKYSYRPYGTGFAQRNSDRVEGRWFKRLARREGKRLIDEQREG